MDLMRSMLRKNGSEVGSRALAGGLGVPFLPSDVPPDAATVEPFSPSTDAGEGRDARA
jgi:hypothetical protein